MGLNIKSARTEAAIRELAHATGEGLTEAIETAVTERLERLKRAAPAQTGTDLLRRLRPVQARIAAERRNRRERRSSREMLNELYDDHGLPK